MVRGYGFYMFSHPSYDNNYNGGMHVVVRNLCKVEGSL